MFYLLRISYGYQFSEVKKDRLLMFCFEIFTQQKVTIFEDSLGFLHKKSSLKIELLWGFLCCD